MLCYAVGQQDWTSMWYTNMVEAFVWEQEKTFNELLKAGQGEWWWGGGMGGNQRSPLSNTIITH